MIVRSRGTRREWKSRIESDDRKEEDEQREDKD